MASRAAPLFESARRALDAGDFAAAAKHAREAEALASAEAQITDHGAPSHPTYSIVVVLYRKHRDLGEAISLLSRYSDRQEFELIFVNNGDFVTHDISSHGCKRFRWIDAGFNYGCSGGRNMGAQSARGDFLIFLDDDGFIDDHAVEHLVETVTEHHAIVVRGRVLPKNKVRSWSEGDLGDEVVYSVPNAEGISIWRRKEFLEHGGFDILLAGGEGKALWSKMYHHYGGSKAFLYTPRAILLHDFVTGKRKGTPNEAYFHFAYPDAERQRRNVTLEFIGRAIKCNPESAELHHHLGSLLQRWGGLEEAEASHRRAIELKPNLAASHHQLSGICAQRDRRDEALAAARRAVECDPKDAWLHHHLGSLLQRWGGLEEAEASHRRAIELKPNLAAAHRQLSVICAQRDRRDEALAAARRAIECDPKNARLHHHLGNLLQMWGGVEEAEAAHRRAIELKPDLAGAHRQLSIILTQHDRQDEALAAARRAIACDPKNARLHHHLGNLLQMWGGVEEAEAAHRRAIELEPDLAGAHRQLSIILAQHDRQDEALAAARRAIECDPENAKFHHHLGNLLQKWERLKEAEVAHRQAIELKPAFAGAHRQLSMILAQHDRQDEALRTAARRAIERDPENAKLHHHLGKSAAKMGRLEEAEAAHRRAIELKPAFAGAHGN